MNTKPRASTPKQRSIQLEGREIISHGHQHSFWHDFYHLSLTVSWHQFMAIAFALFVLVNAFFAVLYSLQANSVGNLYPNNIMGAFFFSVETLATVGYGNMYPQTVYAHLIATLEVFIGMAAVAVITGLIFARFSKPRARILFAQHPIVTRFNGERTLMLRVANARQNYISNATAKLHLILREPTAEGASFRRIYDLPLVRDNQPMFFLGWSIMHPINQDSVLYELSAQDLADKRAVLVLQIIGNDDTTSQTMQARQTYTKDAILWNHRYVDAIYTDDNDAVHIDYTLFHQTKPLEEENRFENSKASMIK